MARRSEHSLEEIKEMVLDAAQSTVIEEGVGALKVRKIALDIGYTVGSIYMVFDNMADLITHVKGRTLDDIAAELNAVDANGPPEHCILALARAYVNFASRHFNRWRMIFEPRSADDPPLPGWYQQKIDALFNVLEVQIARLALSLPREEAKRAARALWGGIHGVCWLSLTGKLDAVGVKDVENTLVLLVESFLRGWSAAPDS
ncbi:MAG: TetR/AcrR family transcriptional regulator [Gammaproteobacteria bacterium HGW-Gammaproteobacteria-3]|nr:MAG: TetR/AcrR family transcriptional regulator [Gammaproteobacteria bacterium HGW-Gammaproteobacteria-3]